jgi:hypothetical protein
VPQAAAFDQAVEVFSEIGGVVSGTLQSLRHEKHVKTRSIAARSLLREVLLE